MQPWKTIERRTLIEHSKFLSVEEHTVELPDGTVIDDWSFVITPDFINVIAMTTEDKFICFRQTKYAIDGISIAPVGGYIEKNEDPLIAAKRELLEETGYQASEWTYLGKYNLMPNRNPAVGYAYLARGAQYTQPIDSDDLEEQELLLLDQDELEQFLVNGEIKVSAWVNTIALALFHLKSQKG